MPSSSDFQTLRTQFQGDLVTPSDAGYPDAIKRWSHLAELPAELIAFVKDEADVTTILAFARDHDMEVAIKCGGHNVSGASSSDKGVVIDLSRYMNTVQVDPEHKIANVGGGALLRDLERESFKYGLATVVGTVNHTGVAGLTLGGGYGWLTGQHGLALDNVVGARIVVANGTVLDVSKDSNPDLFWAIQGGGSNFGVVTQFKFALHPQRSEVFYGLLRFASDRAENFFAVCEELRMTSDPKSGIVVGFGSSPEGPELLAFIFHNGPLDDARQIYKKLYELSPKEISGKMIPFLELNEDSFQSHGKNYYTSGYVLALNQSLSDVGPKVFDEFSKVITDHPELSSSFFSFDTFPNDKINSVDKDDTCFNGRGYHSNCMLQVTWDVGGDNTMMFNLQELGLRSGHNNETAIYSNLANEVTDSEERVKSLFGDHYPRSQVIKAKYDPDMVFHRWFPIVPNAKAMDLGAEV